GVGLGRAVSAYDPDRFLGADLAMNLPQEVDQMGIHLDHLRFAPVTQQVVDFPERLVVIPTVHLVGDGQFLVGVDVVEGDRPRLAVGPCVLQVLVSEKDENSGDAAAVARPDRTQGQYIPVRDYPRHVPTLVGASALNPRRAPWATSSVARHGYSPRRRRLTHCSIREGLTRC